MALTTLLHTCSMETEPGRDNEKKKKEGCEAIKAKQKCNISKQNLFLLSHKEMNGKLLLLS